MSATDDILAQLVQAQGETNQRLDALIEGRRTTNQLLARIAGALERQSSSATEVEAQTDAPFTRPY